METNNLKISNVYFSENYASYDWLHPKEKQYNLSLNILFDNGAPAKKIYATFEESQLCGKETPEEVLEILEEKIKSYWYSGSREKDLETIAFIKEHIEEINSIWAKRKIEECEKEIKRLSVYVIE